MSCIQSYSSLALYIAPAIGGPSKAPVNKTTVCESSTLNLPSNLKTQNRNSYHYHKGNIMIQKAGMVTIVALTIFNGSLRLIEGSQFSWLILFRRMSFQPFFIVLFNHL